MTTKRTLLTSAVSLVLCICMLLGTTFAWFTDAVTSSGNIIASGKLDAEMYWSDKLLAADSDEWNNADGTSVFNYNNWEPGYTEVRYVKVSNAGSLNFRWKLSIEAEGNVTDLSDVINVYYVNPVTAELTKEGLKSLTPAGTLTDVLENNTSLDGRQLTPDSSVILAIAFHMDELADNKYQNKSLCDAGFSLKLLATQDIGESDSFGDDYDGNAFADIFAGFQGGSAAAAVTTNDEGTTTSAVSMSGGDVSAEVPAGVKVADGVKSLELVISMMDASGANIQLGATEAMQSLDVHMEGVAEGNTIPMLITLREYLPTGLNSGALKIYHVEDGNTVVMTQAANPVNHNEFSYDPLTGSVTLAMASFSEVAVVADATNTWNGTAATAFAGGNGTEANPYLIANADQLAYFRNEVDGGRTFDNEFVKLTANIYLSNVNFDPIGWGYEYNDWNVGDQTGKPFKGTFDGNGKTIFDLYQNGWDMINVGTGEAYTYTNCGFGLFAAAADATFKNLNIYGAYVRVECVETGILVGLSQGNCTYENINIHNSKIANYQRPTGGLIGEISPLNGGGETKITNVTIGSDVVVGSLWGDFDAPCGGVIGARWDDSNTTTVKMKDVEVGARMDVYSDVTSAYQWYAYRRAGMLIGNTEQTAENNGHLAAARFLTCENVKVYYGDWAAYHYCQFENQTDAQGNKLWNSNYPWVRVEAGENCSAYSNPRYGQPVINGVTVTTHEAGVCTGEHNMERRFNQLYGGGQGVYGQFEHEGVEVINYRYSITYVNDYEVLAIKYVTESGAVNTANDVAKKLVCEWADVNIGKDEYKFGGWMNAGSTKLTQIDADNTKNIVLYPWFNDPYTARFVDQNGNVVAYCFFHAEDLSKLEDTRILAEAALPDLGEDLKFDYWEVLITDNEGNVTKKVKYSEATFDKYENDVTIYPVYLFKGDVNLVPVDTDSEGIIDHYQVAGYSNPNGQAMVEIPASVNGKPILQINQNAFSGYDGVHSIVVPNGVTIQKNAFTEGSRLGSGEEITIYFEGTKAQWNALNKETGWDYGIGNNSRVFFLKDGKVDTTQGYLQVGSRKWNEKTDFASVKDQYSGYCDCKEGTSGDTGHIYVRVNADGSETIMQHNANGTPVNEQNVEIYWGVIKEGGIFGIGKKEGLRDDDTNDTYKRYRPDAIYWEGVTV